MNDLDMLNRLGPKPTAPSAAAMGAARARLDAATAQAPVAERRSRRLPLLSAAAAAAIGLAVAPALVGSDGSIALAAVDPMTFPLTSTAIPRDLGDPVFERDSNFTAARYGPALNGVTIVTDVDDKDHWSIPDSASTVEVDGHQGTVFGRTVFNGTPDSAPSVTIIWQTDDRDWTAVTGSGDYADDQRVEAIAESLQEEPQPVDLALSVAPSGWSVLSYKEDRILTLGSSDEAGGSYLTVALVQRVSANLAEYGAQDVETLRINGAPAQLGRQAADAGDPTWILEAQASSEQPFSVQAPAVLTRDQVIQIAEGVTYQP